MHGPAPSWFDRLAFVLVRPSHPGNVGAVARAMRTMGLRRLVLVAPADGQVLAHPAALARASGAVDVLAQARLAPDLAGALAPFTLAVAVSAAGREFGPPPEPPEAVAQAVRHELGADPAASLAFVFGPERTGLGIADVGLCQRLCTIPGDESYNSLNLAQAAQIMAYCLRAIDRLETAAGSDPARAPAGGGESRAAREGFATLDEVEGLFAHLQTALVRIGFLDPSHPKKLMPRLRRLLGRTRLEREEIAILRGICTQIEKLAAGDIHGPRRSPAADGAGRAGRRDREA